MLNTFRIEINGSLTQQSMVDGIVDEYEDETGIDTGSSTNENYNSTDDYYSPVKEVVGVDANTGLMIHGNGGDESGNAHNITYNGNAKLDGTRVFGPGSSYFNGSSAYLSIADHVDWDLCASSTDYWTIDFWVKHTDHAGVEYYITQYEGAGNYWDLYHVHGSGIKFDLTSASSLVINTGYGGEITDTDWHHIALCKVADKYAIYKDGTQVNYVQDSSTDNLTGTLQIGRRGTVEYYLDGYMDEIRIIHDTSASNGNPFGAAPVVGLTDTITVPTAAHTSNAYTKLLLHFDANYNDSGNTNHTSNITNNNCLLVGGKFGYGGLELDDSGDYLSLPDSADWDIIGNNTDTWTVDFWVRHTDHVGVETYIEHYEDGNNYWQLWHYHGNGLIFNSYSGGVEILTTGYGGEITDTNWHHIALVIKGTGSTKDIGIYKDGTRILYLQDDSIDTFTGNFTIGRAGWGANYLDGNLDGIRISKSNIFSADPSSADPITPPTSAPSSDANSKLILNFNDGDVWGGHDVEPQGGCRVDKTTKKWGNGSWYFNGSTDYLELPDSSDWDIVASNSDNQTIDFWVKHTDHVDSEFYMEQYSSPTSEWKLYHSHGTGIVFSANIGGLFAYLSGGGEITDTNWHHIALIKVGSEYAIYKDGTQTDYVNDSSTGNVSAPLYIGMSGASSFYFDGYMDEIRIQHSNIFSAAPNVGETDTITTPTSEYAMVSATYNMTLFSNGNTAEAQPDTARIVLFEEDVDAITINTDLKAYVSRDGGTTYTQVTLADKGDYDNNKRLLAATIDISGQPSGTNMKYKLESLNNKDLKIHGTGLLWDG
jgi:hypothetical protein